VKVWFLGTYTKAIQPVELGTHKVSVPEKVEVTCASVSQQSHKIPLAELLILAKVNVVIKLLLMTISVIVKVWFLGIYTKAIQPVELGTQKVSVSKKVVITCASVLRNDPNL